ncbi:MAG: hypothetical protein LBI70_03420 [Rickettsiales bacterium]|jgi:hypothetical protein|nr:hypothetical protein [Rickettsiales bacterium]
MTKDFRILCSDLCTDDFLGSFSFSDLLIFLGFALVKNTTVSNFFKSRGYRCDNLEDFFYRMIFFENQNFELTVQRVLYFALASLKNMGWTKEDEENHALDYTIDDICSLFDYPEGSEHIICYTPRTKEEKGVERLQNYRLEKYFDKYKFFLNPWSKVKLDIYPELFDNKFALLRNGKFKNHLITGNREENDDMSLRIWTDNIFVEEKQYKFTFGSREEMENFLLENKVVIDSCLDNDFFSDEKSHISAFREQFDNQDFFELRNFKPF